MLLKRVVGVSGMSLLKQPYCMRKINLVPRLSSAQRSALSTLYTDSFHVAYRTVLTTCVL